MFSKMSWIQQSKIKFVFLIIIICLLINVCYKYFWFANITIIGYPIQNLTKTQTTKAVVLPIVNKIANLNVTYPELPVILDYTTFWGSSMFSGWAVTALNNCSYKCRWSNDKSLYPIADAAIFFAPKFMMDPMLSSNINPKRLNVFYTRESSGGRPLSSRDIPKDFFNVTLTFRRDSTIFKPFDRFDEIKENEKNDSRLVWNEEEITKILNGKTKLALKIVSHCPTNSKREDYLDALNKVANISLYGKCYNDSFSTKETKRMWSLAVMKELRSHHFYLAFENNVCKDYITEKFWRLKQLIVPVVLKRSILRGIVDDKYFIAADDFASPKELAERLIYLSKNHTEYRKYFEWTKQYKKTTGFDEREMCQLCEMINKKEKHTVPNIFEWWENPDECIPNFAKTLL